MRHNEYHCSSCRSIFTAWKPITIFTDEHRLVSFKVCGEPCYKLYKKLNVDEKHEVIHRD